MSMNSNRVYFSDILDEKKHIDPYKVVLFVVDVGAGKTSLVKKWIAEGRRVAYFTNRAAKRLQDMNGHPNWGKYLSLDGNLDSHSNWLQDTFGYVAEEDEPYLVDGTVNRPGCYLPIQLSGLMEDMQTADPQGWFGSKDYLWDAYDYIVVDECQYIQVDSTYQLPPIKMWFFMRAFVERCSDPNKHLILMTATPDSIMDLLVNELNCKVWDFRGKTNTVKPKEIRFIHAKLLNDEFVKHLANEEKFIYFTNGETSTIREFCKTLANSAGSANELDYKRGVFMHRNGKKKKKMETDDPPEYEKLQRIEQELIEHEMLSSEVDFAVFSPGYMEAINIKNKDIQYVYVDDHIPPNIIQYAGRIRAGNFVLIIVDKSYQHEYDLEDEKYDQSIAKMMMTTLNGKLHALQEEEKYEEADEFISNTEKKNTYIAYNVFHNQFEYNFLKERQVDYSANFINKWNKLDRSSKTSFSSYVRSFFNIKGVKAEITPYITPEWECKKIWHDMKMNDTKKLYTKEQLDNLVDRFSYEWNSIDCIEHRINWYVGKMSKYMYERIRKGKNVNKYKLVERKKKTV